MHLYADGIEKDEGVDRDGGDGSNKEVYQPDHPSSDEDSEIDDDRVAFQGSSYDPYSLDPTSLMVVRCVLTHQKLEGDLCRTTISTPMPLMVRRAIRLLSIAEIVSMWCLLRLCIG